MNAVTQFVKALGPTRLAAMGAVAAGLIGFFIFLMMRFSQPHMTVLFSDLPFEDSVAVVKKLEGMNVPHQVRQNGAIILVPKENMLRLRMKLAEDGLPAGGSVGYEIFDKSDSLGATRFVQNINQLRALEGELARTIRSLDRVSMARVHLVIPQRKLFARKKVQPTASIVIKARGSLDSGHIKAIQHLVAAAIQGLEPGRVSIVNDRGKLLASGRNDGPGEVSIAQADERNTSFEKRMQREIEEIVGSIVGLDRVRVQVAAELDYNKITETTDVYDPDGQVVRSTQIRNESSSATQPNNDGAVTVGNELPAANAKNDASGQSGEKAQKSEEVINYEISRTTKTQTIAAGRIKRISVAVLVDGVYTKGANGQPAYAPHPQADLDEIAKLVRSAIGFDRERGDKVHVANLRFASNEKPSLVDFQEKGLFDLSKDDYFYIAELAITLTIALLVLLFVARPLIRRIVTPDETDGLLDPPLAKQPQLPRPQSQPVESQLALEPPSMKSKEMLELAKVTGEVQASTINEVGEIVGNNPQEAVSVIREWLHSDAA